MNISMNILTSFRVSLSLMFFLIIPLFGAYNSNIADNGVRCLERERLALLKFKVELIDDYGRLSTWGNEDCCQWKGVLCDKQTNHVIAVDLQGPNDYYQYPSAPLRGKISPSLLELVDLNYLDLSYNDFNKTQIPHFIGSLGNLKHLSLGFSNFSGLIPLSLGHLSMLRHLDLGENWLFIDTNLDWLSGIQSLEYLDLSGINLQRAATWLQVLSKLRMLKEIHLQSCILSGTLPTIFSLGNAFTSLVVLDLKDNSLVGKIPDTLGNLTSLSHLDLSTNNLEGSIPNALGNLTFLSHLELFHNNLEGSIPNALGTLMSLAYLNLAYNNLEGSIPHSLWNLTGLSSLILYGNQLQGELPRSFDQFNDSLIQGHLRRPRLEELDLSQNKLSGRVPNFASFLSLRYLYLDNNMFNGTLTKSIGSLSNLSVLDLRSNHLEGLIFEAHFFNLSILKYLDLSFNSNLTIRISSSWNPPFQSVFSLYLGGCNLGPYFPKWLQKLKPAYLDISSGKISDTVPDWFWDIRCLELNMSNNHIYGFLPNLTSITHLKAVDFSLNELNGSLPLLPPLLSTINLARNKFSGTVDNFFNLGHLYIVDLSDNLFSTEISQDCFMNLMTVPYLNLANNNFSGEIPNSVNLDCSITSLHLRNNSFTGEISNSLMNCGKLNILDLGDNKFTGKIPVWLGERMPELAVLSLTSNKFYGSLPSSLCHLTKLQVFDISMNEISGTIPKCLKNFTILSSKLDFNLEDYRFTVPWNSSLILYDNAHIIWKGSEAEYSNTLRLLTFIDLSNNNLTGEIPCEVTSLIGLTGLNLSRNNLVGSIPHDIGKLEVLNFLDLSENNLSGNIPSTLSQLGHLGVLNLSFNNLFGKIPWDDHLQTFSDSIFVGNPGLCGLPLVLKPCPGDKMPKTPPNITYNLEHEDVLFSWGFYFYMVFGFILAFWGVVLTAFLNKWCAFIFHKMVIRIEGFLYDRGFLS